MIGAQYAAERMRRSVADSIYYVGTIPVAVTVSFGIAMVSDGDEVLAQVMDRADQALYMAKRSGRNCVCAWAVNLMDTAETPGAGSHFDTRRRQTHRVVRWRLRPVNTVCALDPCARPRWPCAGDPQPDTGTYRTLRPHSDRRRSRIMGHRRDWASICRRPGCQSNSR